MSKSLFIIGTGTDVGKTYITGLILKKLNECGENSGYFKAVMSGNEREENGNLVPGDAVKVKAMSGIAQPVEEMCPYVYEMAVSPHLAAEIEEKRIDMDAIKEGFNDLVGKYDYITVEGSGGIMCPISLEGEELIMLPDIIDEFKTPCLLIADAGLGTINDVSLTSFYMKERGIPLNGIIFNNYEPGNIMHEDNKRICERLTGSRVISCVRAGDDALDISIDDLKSLYE